jgi:uncharacterized protein YifE (UPF0438 family)
MRVLVIPIFVAVLASLAVVAAAAAVSPEGASVRTFFQDLRAGLSARFGKNREELEVEDVEPVESSLEDFFAAAATEEEAYASAEGLASTIEHVVDGVTSFSRR